MAVHLELVSSDLIKRFHTSWWASFFFPPLLKQPNNAIDFGLLFSPVPTMSTTTTLHKIHLSFNK